VTNQDSAETEGCLVFSKREMNISGNRKLYVFNFDEEPAPDSQRNSTGNISLEGTETND
jgi:hypothetical protein